jgi:hypothetical protein
MGPQVLAGQRGNFIGGGKRMKAITSKRLTKGLLLSWPKPNPTITWLKETANIGESSSVLINLMQFGPFMAGTRMMMNWTPFSALFYFKTVQCTLNIR